MTEPTHWLTYVTPILKRAPKNPPPVFDPSDTYETPRFYPTSSKYLWGNVEAGTGIKPGDWIWMLGVPRLAGRTLAPAIDGLLIVKAKHETATSPMPAGPGSIVSDRAFWFEADEGSKWFPWADATGLIPQCALVRKDGTRRFLPGRPEKGGMDGKGWWKTWGNLLRPGSKLDSAGAAKIKEHVDCISRKSVFISYSWDDGAPLAARFAEIVSGREHSVWLDRFSGPRQMSYGLAHVDNARLGPFLTMALDRCAAFAIIGTKGARREAKDGKPESWCMHERRKARRLKKPGAWIDLPIERGIARGGSTKAHEAELQHLADDVLADLRKQKPNV